MAAAREQRATLMPARRVRRRRRSLTEWAARGTMAVAAAVLGYVGVVQSAAEGLRNTAPERAYVLAPWDGRAAAAVARGLAGPDATPATRAMADRYARDALRRDATAVAAASTLGIDAALRGDERSTARLMAYGERLSRRDLGTQLWAIEHAVVRGDVARALYHYDIALRTSSKSSDLLFPILATAAADPAIRHALIVRLATRPTWSPLFVEYAAANGPDPRVTARLFHDLAATGFSIADLPRKLLVDTLVSRGFFAEAWQYYASFRPGADPGRSRDPGFRVDPAAATAFDWRAVPDPGADASIQQGLLDFAASATVGGKLAEQVQLLPPGTYRLTGHSIGIDQPNDALLYWRLRCRDGRELGQVPVPRSDTAAGRFEGRLIVPADCPVQVLELVARASDRASGVGGQFDRILLLPVRQP